jgi:DNA primase
MEWINKEELWKWRDAIIDKIRLIDLIKEYGIELTTKHTGLFSHQIRCPFHEGKNGGREKTPSFFISDTTNSYNCFACGAGGTIIDFVSSLEGVLPVRNWQRKQALLTKMENGMNFNYPKWMKVC